MKKFMIIAVMMLMSTAASFGVNFSFAEVTDVKQVGNGFFAYAGGEAVAISALQYKQMSEATGFYIIDVDGQKVVAAGDQFVVEPLEVDSVGLSNGQPKVFFKGGSSKVFSNEGWLKVIKGQKIRRAYLNIPTWEFENYATVNTGDVVMFHDKVAPVKKATASAKVETIAPAKVEIITPAKATTTTTATTTSAQGTNEEFSGISFSITH